MKFVLLLFLLLVFPYGVVCPAASADLSSSASLTLLYSGSRCGKLRSCGCVGKNLGGIERECGLVNYYRSDDKTVCYYVDAGGLFSCGNSLLAHDDLSTIALCLSEIYASMRIDAVNVGIYDYLVYAKQLKDLNLPSGFRSCLLSANLVDRATSEPLFAPFRVVEKPRLDGTSETVGIIGVTRSDSVLEEMGCRDVSVADETSAVARYLPRLKSAGCRLVVVLRYQNNHDASLNELTKVLSESGLPSVVICGNSAATARPSDEIVSHNGVRVVSSSFEGRHIGRLVVDCASGEVKNHLEDVDNRYISSPRIVSILSRYHQEYNDSLSTASLRRIKLY
ncbi:hypothetical protein GX645_06790 [Candidatus Sumerlaeota bacterium]|nr:hypothetical protein [Candidatus Sumerlaeales bacterium]NLD62145.1 hypothetical protein [Candidatus Sumerlaeota bacterium]